MKTKINNLIKIKPVMKKIVLNTLLFNTLVLCFASCAFHSGYISDSAALSKANFSYAQKHISGQANTLYVLWIGGNSKEAIIEEAKQDMLTKHPLKSNQALTNITVNWKYGFYFVVSTARCTVTADIVEFKP